jgi:hypothetical protein
MKSASRCSNNKRKLKSLKWRDNKQIGRRKPPLILLVVVASSNREITTNNSSVMMILGEIIFVIANKVVRMGIIIEIDKVTVAREEAANLMTIEIIETNSKIETVAVVVISRSLFLKVGINKMKRANSKYREEVMIMNIMLIREAAMVVTEVAITKEVEVNVVQEAVKEEEFNLAEGPEVEVIAKIIKERNKIGTATTLLVTLWKVTI